MTKVLDLETRKAIYRLIAKHPGLNLTMIAEMLKMNVPLVDYHTRYLEDNELITIVKEGGFKRYYIKGKTGVQDKRFLGVLRQEIPLALVMFLLKNPNSKHKDILAHFNLAASTLTYHLQKLIKNGVVNTVPRKGEQGYHLIDEKEVIRFLIQYKPSKVLKRFKDTWADDFNFP